MIPLRTPAELKKFPTLLFACLIAALLGTLFFSAKVASLALGPLKVFFSSVVFPSVALGVLCVWYLWIFYPSFILREHKKKLLDYLFPFFSLFLVLIFFSFDIEASLSFVFTLLIFGAAMQTLIWENVDTLVIGPRLFTVYSVPSYVHVFFFLFYMFICQLISPAYGMNGKSIYLVSLVTFLVGFLIRALELKGLKNAQNSHIVNIK